MYFISITFEHFDCVHKTNDYIPTKATTKHCTPDLKYNGSVTSL